ncbi:ras-specific guanine nucleotide-releasing factor 2-like isoform X1 [Artemia franciscana]|uniref:ras-specific guanine nucleotide-releasing factor 2-like isoform X1 n=1 Tax=Artemia franciscana TaxID=6661 RepID=UPI0032DBAFC3
MLSPKMQRPIKVTESQLLMLAERARYDAALAGPLYKRTADGTKWQSKWFTLYQNLLFYSEIEHSSRPSGVIFLEGSYCDRLIITGSKTSKPASEKMYCFAVTYRRENQRQYELKADTESDCKAWIEAVRQASFNKLLLQKEELEQKHLHLLQIVESEKTAKWQYTQQCEELTDEIKKLRSELCTLKKEWRLTPSKSTTESPGSEEAETEELKKIRKVQGFFRGWLCRHRWKTIVDEYIKSPHAESMRKRNSLVFRMVEEEEEYVSQLDTLITCFLRPLRMAASSKKPPCSHEDVNSIFLNSETLLFLHQIFLKGLQARIGSWPTLVLDLFDMLLPMLHIYQEYVRNHHFSLQVLTECKQSMAFSALLTRLENKSTCQGRSLDNFLTYPMHQIPRYIITLHELLAHTPHNHVERKSLENARIHLEDLSRQMHDEVSETENIRKNLAIERMIIEGCDILMDINQVFVRQGTLIQVVTDKAKSQRRLTSSSKEKEEIRQCFLFSSHLILATRASNGKLHLIQNIGKIPLADATLIEDPSDHGNDDDGESSVCSISSQSSGLSESSAATSSGGRAADYHGRDFQITVDCKNGQIIAVLLVAPSMQDKQAWISDISQCIDNVHFYDFVHGSGPDTSSVSQPHSIRNDPRLFKDDVDIRFSRTLNSCKVPQIRYATPERLLERLTDLRFLSIDFLNTFLLTYRVFTDGVMVLEALKKVFYNAEPPEIHPPLSPRSSVVSVETNSGPRESLTSNYLDAEFGRNRSRSISPRRTSSVSGYGSEASERERSQSRELTAAKGQQWWRRSRKSKGEEEIADARRDSSPARNFFVSFTVSSPSHGNSQPRSPWSSPRGSTQLTLPCSKPSSRRGSRQKEDNQQDDSAYLKPCSKPSSRRGSHQKEDNQHDDSAYLTIPKTAIGISSSAETLTEETICNSSPTNLSTSTNTLVESNAEFNCESENQGDKRLDQKELSTDKATDSESRKDGETENDSETNEDDVIPPLQQYAIRRQSLVTGQSDSITSTSDFESDDIDTPLDRSSMFRSSFTSQFGGGSQSFYRCRRIRMKRVSGDGGIEGPPPSRSAYHHPDSPQLGGKVGVVVTSHRQSQRRSSTSHAAAAFAVATAGCSNPREPALRALNESRNSSRRDTLKRKESVMSSAATMRVLNVLRHWISKHHQDFESERLKNLTIEFLEDVLSSPHLLPAEHKAASQLLRLLTREEPMHTKVDLNTLLAIPITPSKDGIETLSALEIAEQMTYLDHHIFISIKSEELLGQAWMKTDKATRAPHVILITKRFNEVSRLVVSEITRRQNLTARIAVIDKWTAVADICRCLHNFNGVLQICAALTNSSVFRLRKTWDKLSKTTRQTIEKLQNIVSQDGRFRNLRDALHRCDPPCIPYLGLYLSDLSFIEEGTPNFTEDGLLNFSKMRMIAHVIREIRHFQNTTYKIEHNPKVTSYLLDPSLLLDDEELYHMSLEIEPRQSRLGSMSQPPSNLATLAARRNTCAGLSGH